jgi:hypothetical protein
MALGLDFVPLLNGAPVLPDSVISTPSSWVAASAGRWPRRDWRRPVSRFWSAVDVGRGGSFPRDSTDLNAGWLWQTGGGLFDIRWLDRMLSVQGAGWGGVSGCDGANRLLRRVVAGVGRRDSYAEVVWARQDLVVIVADSPS